MTALRSMLCLLLCSSVCLATSAHAEPTVWATQAMNRVFRDTKPTAWQPALKAARGEWESFQLVITGTPTEIKGMFAAGTCLHGPDDAIIPAPVLLREHYVAIQHSSESAPLPAGDYPDALVPQTVPWPELPKAERINQPFWIDVYVPPDAKPGDYTSTVKLVLTDGRVLTQDFTLHVWDFALPRLPSLKSSMFIVWRRIAKVHGFDPEANTAAPQLQAILDDYYDMLVDHRLSPHEVWATYPDAEEPLSDASYEHMEAGLRKHLLGRQAGMIGLPLWLDWPVHDPLVRGRKSAMNYVTRFYRICEKLGCADRLYKIFGELDEPKSQHDYAHVREWGRFFHEVRDRFGAKVPLLITEQIEPDDPKWGSLETCVDIWDPHVSAVWEDMEAKGAKHQIPKQIEAGKSVWTYTALVQTPDAWKALHGNPKTLGAGQPPVWLTDYPPMNYRILGWLAPRYNISGLSYWETSHWPEGHDVWANNETYPHAETNYNGDGFLIYPAHLAMHGREGPVASIRLKWLRESMDDHDYIQLLTDRGFKNTALDLSATFSRGFGDWNDDATSLYEAREFMASLLERMHTTTAAR